MPGTVGTRPRGRATAVGCRPTQERLFFWGGGRRGVRLSVKSDRGGGRRVRVGLGGYQARGGSKGYPVSGMGEERGVSDRWRRRVQLDRRGDVGGERSGRTGQGGRGGERWERERGVRPDRGGGTGRCLNWKGGERGANLSDRKGGGVSSERGVWGEDCQGRGAPEWGGTRGGCQKGRRLGRHCGDQA